MYWFETLCFQLRDLFDLCWKSADASEDFFLFFYHHMSIWLKKKPSDRQVFLSETERTQCPDDIQVFQTLTHTHTPWQQVRRMNSTGAHLVGPGVRMPFFFLIGADSRWSRDKHVRLFLERELKWLTDTNLCLTPHHRETQDEPDQRLHQNNSQLFPPRSEEELERLHLPH